MVIIIPADEIEKEDLECDEREEPSKRPEYWLLPQLQLVEVSPVPR